MIKCIEILKCQKTIISKFPSKQTYALLFPWILIQFKTLLLIKTKKASDTLDYVNKECNHPLLILKNLTKSLVKCILDISSKGEVFNNSIAVDSEVLQKCGFNDKKEEAERTDYKLNPPLSLYMNKNIRRVFLKLFQKENPLLNIFKRNALK